MSKAPKITQVEFVSSFNNPYTGNPEHRFRQGDRGARIELSPDARWVALILTDKQGKVTSRLVPAEKVDFVEVEHETLAAWLAGAEPEPVKRGPGRPPKPREPEAA